MLTRLSSSLVVLFVLSTINIIGQNTDSLWTVWKNPSVENEKRMDALLAYTEKVYLYNRTDTALILANKMYAFADSINNKRYMGRSKNLQGTANAILRNYDESEASFLKFLEISQELNDEGSITKAFKNLGNIYDVKKDYDQASNYYQKALSRAESLNDSTEILGALYGLSKIKYKNGENDQAINGYNRVLEIAKSLKDQRSESATYYQLLILNNQQGNYSEAIKYGIEGLKISETINDMRLTAGFTNIIGNIYRYQEDYDQALIYYSKSIKTAEENGMKNSIAGTYQNLAYIYAQKGDLPKSTQYYEKSLEIHESYKDQAAIANCCNSLAGNYVKLQQYNKAYNLSNRALEIGKKLSFKPITLTSLTNLSAIHHAQDSIDQAIASATIGLQMADELGIDRHKKSLSFTLYNIYKDLGNTGDALKMYESYTASKDSLDKKEDIRNVLKQTYQYESEKKAAIDSLQFLSEKEILTTKNVQQSRLLYGSGFALFLFSLLSYFIYKLYRKTNKQNEIISSSLKEKDTLLREIHHRVKNNLQLVSSLLSLQSRHIEDPKALEALNSGKSRVKSMALIHQNLYNKENLTGISIKNYLEKLCNELVSTYQIDSNQIKLRTDIQDLDLDIDTIVPLGLIINELLTNALKYAFPENAAGEILIGLKEENKKLILRVSDNGIGLPLDFNTKNSFGYKLISTLNEQLDGTMKKTGDSGTKVEIQFSDYKIAS
jgi:two-component sensor histidine kinase/Tfp pilus assembly protein PilF